MRIDELLRLQRCFDESRGIANLPEADSGSGDRLGRLEYALIGLTGEVGEIANVIKKARRERAMGMTQSADIPVGLGEEIADVLSYLLKLADQAGVDPATAYLTKMARNAHRLWRRDGVASTITVSGPPGVGKTTVVTALAPHFASDGVYFEHFENNLFLRPIDGPSLDFDAAKSQLWFLNEMISFVTSSKRSRLLLDQDPTAIVLVYSQLLLDQGMLSKAEFDDQLATLLELEIDQSLKLAGRTVILLDASPATLAIRGDMKGGPALSKAFLESTRQRFLSFFAGLPNAVTVDADRPLEQVLTDVRASIASRSPGAELRD
jgi:thymidylate kinase/NTP pyrophosphatase (non-canonical NTP hydrolase)